MMAFTSIKKNKFLFCPLQDGLMNLSIQCQRTKKGINQGMK